MNNKLKQITIKNSRNYFFDDKIIIKNLDPNKIKIDKKILKKILIYYIEYENFKYIRQVEVSRVNPLYLSINKMNGCIEENSGNKYLTLRNGSKTY